MIRVLYEYERVKSVKLITTGKCMGVYGGWALDVESKRVDTTPFDLIDLNLTAEWLYASMMYIYMGSRSVCSEWC